MNVSTKETPNCHRCHGTGSGLYNVLSPESTCEVCHGTGLATAAQPATLQAVGNEAIS